MNIGLCRPAEYQNANGGYSRCIYTGYKTVFGNSYAVFYCIWLVEQELYSHEDASSDGTGDEQRRKDDTHRVDGEGIYVEVHAWE